MSTFPRNRQSGQAMSEFVAAMALFIPLVLGVIYIGKYGDIKHQAIQASRYAALERAMNPNTSVVSDDVVNQETVARFFRDGSKQSIAMNEQALAATRDDENPNWTQLNGDPMLAHYSDVKVSTGFEDINSTYLAPVDIASGAFFSGLNTGYGTRSRVSVNVANIAHFDPLSNINLQIGASTVMAGDPWNAAGAASVNDHMTIKSVPGKALQLLNNPLLNRLFNLFVDTPVPQFGCVKPDVVPESAAPSAAYDPTDDPNSPSNPNDKCY